MKEFNESEHPRDGEGKFAEKGEAGSNERVKTGEDFFDGDKPEYEEDFFEQTSKEGLTKTKESGTIKFKEVNAKEFHKAIIAAKESNAPDKRWRVDAHNEIDYSKDKLFITAGGSCVAIEPSGNIISVCKNQNNSERGAGTALLKKAIENGGDRLDAFGEDLYNFYTSNSFEPISWIQFDEEYAPNGWKKEYGNEPIIFYRYVGKQVSKKYSEFTNEVKPQDEYEKALQIRDKEINKK